MVAGGQSNMGGSDRGNLTGGTVLGAALGAQTQNTGGENTDNPVRNERPM
jgi:hypothetical protein